MSSKIDLRALYRRIGELEQLNQTVTRLLERIAEERPIDGSSRAYYMVPGDLLGELREQLSEPSKVRACWTCGPNLVEPEDIRPLEVFRLEIPLLPPRQLRGNAAHRAGAFDSTRKLKEASKAAVVNALESFRQLEPLFTEPIAVDVVIAWGRKLNRGKISPRIMQERALDWDAAAATLKPFLDALTDLKIWEDDRLIIDGRLRQSVDPTGAGATVFTIWRLEAERN